MCNNNIDKKKEAEEKRDLYKSVREDIEDYLEGVDEMSYYRSMFEKEYDTIGKNPDSAYGEFYEMFKDRLDIAREEMDKSLGEIENAIKDVKSKLEKIEEKEKYWEEIAR